jgi:hypothetical protein
MAFNQSAAGAPRFGKSGWTIKRQTGSHRVLARLGFPDYVFVFHDGDEIGPGCWRALGSIPALHPTTTLSAQS